MLESQRDLEAIEAEYNAYAEEDSKVNAEIRESEIKVKSPLSAAVQCLAPPKFFRVQLHLLFLLQETLRCLKGF